MKLNEKIHVAALQQGLNQHTIKLYKSCIHRFLQSKQNPHEFLDHLMTKDRVGSSIKVYAKALEFFYNSILDTDIDFNLNVPSLSFLKNY